MSDIILFGVEEEGKFRLEKLIQIRCLVRDCKVDKAELIQLPSIINIYDLGDVRVLLYICIYHYTNNRNAINYDNIFNKQISFCQYLVKKPLKCPQISMPHELMVRQAEIKLDKNSCCIRENFKYFNLKQMLTILQLVSQDDMLVLGLVKRALITKYIELLEIKREINKAFSNKIDILKYFTLLHRFNQIKNQISSHMKQNIKDSGIILQPFKGTKDIFQNKLGQEND